MRKQLILVGVLCLLLLPISANAQAPALTPGTEVAGVLDAENFAANYIFTGSAGDSVTLDALGELEIALLLTAPNGAVVAQSFDPSVPTEALIADFALPQDGQYVVTVLRAGGVVGAEEGGYTLTLTGTLTPPSSSAPPATDTPPADTAAEPALALPQNVTLTNGGIDIALVWGAAVNLDIEVRDPRGGAIFSNNRIAPSGGALSEDVNAECNTATADNPTERVSWSPGEVPAGSYEIILYYTDACTVGGPQQFTLSATVDGDEAQTIAGTLNPSQQYLAAVEIDASGGWTLFNGGVNAGLDVSLLATQIAASQPLPSTTVTGSLNRSTPALAYTFEGVAGDTVSITLDATSGSLDPYLILLAPSGGEAARNDDRADGDVNSTITSQLAQSGVYTIVATRFGQTIGGTEGAFVLNVGLAVVDTAATTGTTDTTTAAPLPTTPPTDPLATSSGTATRPADLPAGSIEVILTWQTTADVQLLVRDPSGAPIYDDAPSSNSGGILDQIGNARCLGNTAPVSYIYWPTSLLPRGIYEIDVWYQDTCNNPNPVTFNLIVNVQGQEIINTTQPTTPGSHFGVTFEIDQEGNAVAGAGGFFNMDDAASVNYFNMLGDAEPVEYGDTTPGTITFTEKFHLYSFEGRTGDRIRVAMQATSGNLDTAVYLISPDGVQLAGNDDVVNPVTGERDTNSLIDSVTLSQAGTYYILATHYGLQYGGTVGTYNMTLFQLPPG